ncbi:hypothetical protein AB0758_29730 [Tolypothrix bouteillei VB521301_2]|uniref:Uncharacterized protein n=1 Tax=Tolypothrix bouteillei VB521301 TaxID=1479485 RepID=A0A0C1NJS2_9CYAN
MDFILFPTVTTKNSFHRQNSQNVNEAELKNIEIQSLYLSTKFIKGTEGHGIAISASRLMPFCTGFRASDRIPIRLGRTFSIRMGDSNQDKQYYADRTKKQIFPHCSELPSCCINKNGQQKN